MADCYSGKRRAMDRSAVEHVSVLGRTLAEQIRLPQEAAMVDATIGQGGHSYLFGQELGPAGVLIGLDIDENNLRRAQVKLQDLACKVILIRANFSQIRGQVHKQGIERVDFILADLGTSSSQLEDAGMGLSFRRNERLDMRFDKRIKTTAADIVNKLDERSLAELIYKFGQEKASRRIARFIAEHRKGRAITTSGQLARIVCQALGQSAERRRSRIHPATRTFQALRIAVNDELENLRRLLEGSVELLKKDGRIAVISFHSLEDRIVKENFRRNEQAGRYRVITKKPITPSREEIRSNRRSRSAKLRIAEKIRE
jgi:16S rRNA (cytosine1402-N4)-methyltransferase